MLAKRQVAPIGGKSALVSIPRVVARTAPPASELSELNPTKFEELSQLHMKVAVLMERIAQLQDELLRKAA